MKIQKYESYIAEAINGTVARTPYLPDVNDFPSVCALRNTINREHIGAGKQEYVETFILRGYAYSSLEDAIDSAEALARAIEYHTSQFVISNLRDARVLSITTDEGFLAPYSLCETEIEFSYDYTNTSN
jgi:hypothetical protein